MFFDLSSAAALPYHSRFDPDTLLFHKNLPHLSIPLVSMCLCPLELLARSFLFHTGARKLQAIWRHRNQPQVSSCRNEINVRAPDSYSGFYILESWQPLMEINFFSNMLVVFFC